MSARMRASVLPRHRQLGNPLIDEPRSVCRLRSGPPSGF
jgi:hypothetical protein